MRSGAWNGAKSTLRRGRGRCRRSGRKPAGRIVSLCLRPALEVLQEARQLQGLSGLVFPSATGRKMQGYILSRLVAGPRDQGIGSRLPEFSFRVWAAESGYPREICEQALAHVLPGIEASYQRSSLV